MESTGTHEVVDNVRKQPAFKSIHVEQAIEAAESGQEVIVAVIADGAIAPTSLQDRFLTQINVLKNESAEGYHGLGTQIGSLIAAICPKAKILPIRVLNANGSADELDILRGLDAAITGKASIIVLPLGGGGSLSPEYQERFQSARNQGILVIVPAGNNGQAETTSFAQSRDVLVVGSTDREGHRATFSNYGRSVELAAPGSDILSNTLDGKLRVSSGGSFSCALVGGVAALVRSVNPQLTASEVEDVLKKSATPIPNAQLGAGQIDANAAVAAAKNH
jgi:subtilisin family serine protease